MKACQGIFYTLIFTFNILAATVREYEIVNNTKDKEMTVELQFIAPPETKKVTVSPGKIEKVTSESCLQKAIVTDAQNTTKETRVEPMCIKQKITIEPYEEKNWQVSIVNPEEKLKKGEPV